MRAGKLRNIVLIQQNLVEKDVAGGSTTDKWETKGRRWCELRTGISREFVDSARFQADATHTVIMRFYKGLTQSYRLADADRLFHILGIQNTGDRDIEHVVVVKEVTP